MLVKAFSDLRHLCLFELAMQGHVTKYRDTSGASSMMAFVQDRESQENYFSYFIPDCKPQPTNMDKDWMGSDLTFILAHVTTIKK